MLLLILGPENPRTFWMIGLRETLDRIKMKIIEHSLKLLPFKLLWVTPLTNPIGSKGNLATTIP